MPSDNLWNQLLQPEILTRGWHLARLDTKHDFAEDLYSTDVFGIYLKLHIREIINRLQTETYQPRPLLRMEVPKGSLGFRPGAVIPIPDRVVVSAIVLLIAPDIDKKFPKSVYSWRLKDPLPKTGSIFKDTDVADIPFLKQETIKAWIDPFDSWYEVWPEFDEESRNAFLKDGYRFLATTDIAAYFENIQLPILRDQLLSHFPSNLKIVNLLFSFLESWASKTADGRPHLRGIPQGNFISSFLGNMFLMPLDEYFRQFPKEYNILYYRYMDDARIFTKNIANARRVIFSMDRELRKLHLNVQTAKTKILDEKHKEVSHALIDERVDKISNLIEKLEEIRNTLIPEHDKKKYLSYLNKIAHQDSPSNQKILGSRRPLEGLTVRAFMRWIYAHCIIFKGDFIDRLLTEVKWNPDYKFTSAKLFPRKRRIESDMIGFIKSDENIFPHQEAEILRALRYLSRLGEDIIEHCKSRLHDHNKPPYLRMQAAYLLSRTQLKADDIKTAEDLFDREQHPYVQAALSILMVQKKKDNASIVRKLVFHPNEKIGELGRFYRCIKDDKSIATNYINHIFRKEIPWLVCDNMALVHIMSLSENPDIRKLILDAIREPRHQHPVRDIQIILQSIFTRTQESLRKEKA